MKKKYITPSITIVPISYNILTTSNGWSKDGEINPIYPGDDEITDLD